MILECSNLAHYVPEDLLAVFDGMDLIVDRSKFGEKKSAPDRLVIPHGSGPLSPLPSPPCVVNGSPLDVQISRSPVAARIMRAVRNDDTRGDQEVVSSRPTVRPAGLRSSSGTLQMHGRVVVRHTAVAAVSAGPSGSRVSSTSAPSHRPFEVSITRLPAPVLQSYGPLPSKRDHSPSPNSACEDVPTSKKAKFSQTRATAVKATSLASVKQEKTTSKGKGTGSDIVKK